MAGGVDEIEFCENFIGYKYGTVFDCMYLYLYIYIYMYIYIYLCICIYVSLLMYFLCIYMLYIIC
jgi:hypothetical protein